MSAVTAERPAAAVAVPALLDRALVYVTGTGGAGKTTVAAVLGLAAATRGRHAVVCDLAGSNQLARAYGASETRHSLLFACQRSPSTPSMRSRTGCDASPAAPPRWRC